MKKKQSPFEGITTREQFTEALQQSLASGRLTEAGFNAARLLCKMKGWDTPPSEASEALVAPEVKPGTVVAPVSGGDGFWYWREDSKKPWSGPLTTTEMVDKYNELAAAGLEEIRAAIASGVPRYRVGRYTSIAILKPSGENDCICCEPPCTLEMLDALNAKPPRSLNDPW